MNSITAHLCFLYTIHFEMKHQQQVFISLVTITNSEYKSATYADCV